MTAPGKKKILCIGPPAGALKVYEDLCRDFDVHVTPRGGREEVVAAIKKQSEENGPFEGMFLCFANGSYGPMDEGLLGPLWKNGNKLGVFAQCGTGYDNVNVDDISAHGCYFTNTPDAVTEATADFTVLSFLSVLRGATMVTMAAHAGRSQARLELTTDPSSVTLGIIGMGRIGKSVVRKLRPFGTKIIYHTRNQIDMTVEKDLDLEYRSLDDLCKEANVIMLLIPSTADSYHLIDTRHFEMMKPGTFFVNTSRGTVVNEEALIEAMKSDKISRAALDVFEFEPAIPDYFKNNPRVTISPHCAAYTSGTIFRGEKDAMDNVRAFLETGKPNSPVNGPF